MTGNHSHEPALDGDGSPDLRRWAWLSIVASIVVITLKVAAYAVTGSVGLLSDAAESSINLVAAVFALAALTIAARPADERHHYGHGKIEYFSAGLEGIMIFVASGFIMISAVQRFLNPEPLESIGLGLAISMVATAINLAVGLVLIKIGRQHRSITLEADGRHLMTDVWTTVGVVVGVGLVGITGWQQLDSIVAFLVGVNILGAGTQLIIRSSRGLLDHALPEEDVAPVIEVLRGFTTDEVHFHGLQTRESGRERFVSVHVLVPGAWTVQQGHDLLEDLEEQIRAVLPGAEIHTHLEPSEDERAYGDFGGAHDLNELKGS